MGFKSDSDRGTVMTATGDEQFPWEGIPTVAPSPAVAGSMLSGRNAEPGEGEGDAWMTLTAATLVTFRVTDSPRIDPALAGLIIEVTTAPVRQVGAWHPHAPLVGQCVLVDSAD